MTVSVSRPSSPHLQVLPALRQLEQRRLAIVKRARHRQIRVALIGLAVFGLIMWAARDLAACLVFGGLTVLFTLGGISHVQRRMMRDVVASYKTQVIPRLIESLGENLTYHRDRFISRTLFMRSHLFFHWPERYHGEDLVTGKIGETRIRFSEIQAQARESLSEESPWITVFKGIFFQLDFNKAIQGSVFLYPDVDEGVWGKNSGQWIQDHFKSRGELIKLEDPEFERHFVVYASDQVEARYILSPSLMRRIVAFHEKAGSPVAMAFLGGKLYIAIPRYGAYLEPNVFKSFISRKEITRVLDELQFALGIVEDLNLNLRIWERSAT